MECDRLELLTHYKYEIHYWPSDKNCAADTLSQCAELKPLDRKDNQPLCLIPKTKFSKIAACEAELTDSDWQDLTDIILTALMISDMDILSETWRISQDWQDKPEGLEWEDGLGWKDGWIWIPEDGICKKVMGLYHNSLVTGHLGTSGTTELVSCSYWHHNLPDYMKQYMQGVIHADRQNIGINANLESYSWSPLPVDPGNGFNPISWRNFWGWADLMPFTLFPINSWRWCISFLQWPTSLLPISWSCMSTIYGNCMGFHLYMVLTTDPPSWQTLQRISTRSSELNPNFLLHIILRHRDRSKITTNRWKCTFGCSVCIGKMIGQIYFWQQNFPTIITTICQSTQLLFCKLWISPNLHKCPECWTVWWTWWTDLLDLWDTGGV